MKKITTKELVQELINREGVQDYYAEPYSKYEIKIEESQKIFGVRDTGPAIILTVID